MPAQRARRGARRIEQHDIEALIRAPFARVRRDERRGEARPFEIFRDAFEPLRRLIQRRHDSAGVRELHRLAAGRGAEIGDAQPRDVAEQTRRRRRRRVLHPPGALREARQRGDFAAAIEPHAVGVDDAAAQGRRPMRGIGFHGDVERRLAAQSARYGVCRFAAIGGAPAREQPVGKIGAGRLRGKRRRAVGRDPAQHGVDQLGERRRRPRGLRDTNRLRHHRMRRRAHHQQLGGAGAQDCPRQRSGIRQRLLQILREHCIDAAEPAQRRACDGAREGAVAAFKAAETLRVGQRVVERAAVIEHFGYEHGGGAPRGSACRRHPHGPRRRSPHGPGSLAGAPGVRASGARVCVSGMPPAIA